MKHTHFLLFFAAAFVLCSCEKTIMDDRERPVPENPGIAWLLSVELTRIPQSGLIYSCLEVNTANPNFMHLFSTDGVISSKDLPILWKIKGGQRLDKENEIHAFSIMSSPQKDPTALEILLVDTIPTFNQLKSIGLPTRLEYSGNGVSCKLHLRYD
ncbi:MAG: hypothetical protein J5761_03080 [Paludibacteraceae bacterium]|nr:hypothetical protein [Paludibacteraceae bacterium]